MTVQAFVRRETGEYRKKYSVDIVDGDVAPSTHHTDGWTRWKNGWPRSYTRATNEIRVGWQWLCREFPASVMATRLVGMQMVGGSELLDVEIADREWLKERAVLAAESATAWASRQARQGRESDRADSDCGRRRL